MIKHSTYLVFVVLIASCQVVESGEIFYPLDAYSSGVEFNNSLVDTPDFNIMEYLYYYNGGGVAAGDINNDGYVDLFFAGNQVNDALYMNNGDLTFQDISESSGITNNNGWSTGVTMIDLNADGWLDIYVCRLGDYLKYKDHNRLYINQKDGTFTEESNDYGLDFKGFSTQAAFLDYDRDGDLDCYLLNHSIKRPEQFAKSKDVRFVNNPLAGDMLLQNNDRHFDDVSKDAGILSSEVGFGLGIATADINNDGWIDIYIGNDFHENDYLYMNNGDGTFTDKIESAVGHTSNFTMGTTIADVNSDGKMDILSLDMLPNNEEVFKRSGGWENLQIYNFKRSYGYHHQLPKNALQVNLGNQENTPIFSEQSALYGLNATDWSWSPLIADFDLDGDKDMFITNGIPRRPNDMDFVNFMSDTKNSTSGYYELIDKMGSGEVRNVYFNNDHNTYNRKEIGDPSVSTGACIADLDNDGDWDIVTNNIGTNANIWINKTNPKNYLKINLKDTGDNLQGIGSTISVNTRSNEKGSILSAQITSSSGFLSMNETAAIFPVDDNSKSVTVNWADGSSSEILIDKNKNEIEISKEGNVYSKNGFTDSTLSFDSLSFGHEDEYFNDQNSDPLLPYLRSNLSPKMAKNKQGEIYVSQGKGKNGFIMDAAGEELLVTINKGEDVFRIDETDAVFFDADGDGDEDLYVCIGGMELAKGNLSLMDRLYLYENGQYINNMNMLPFIALNTSVVAAYDYDQDGDIDLFLGVQGVQSQYGLNEESYLLENIENKQFKAKSIGISDMIYDAKWADIDGDKTKDLIIAGHWIPLTIFYNRENGFVKEEIPNSSGLWFTIEVYDLNEDGKLDIIGGNFGENHRIKVDNNNLMNLYVFDFDSNFSSDPIISYHKNGKEYPYANLDLFIKQLPYKKKEFQKHIEYSTKEIKEIFSKDEIKSAEIKSINTLASHLFIQKVDGWEAKKLPIQLQLAPIMTIEQFGNGFIVGGNLYDVDPNWGKQDALPVSFFSFENDTISLSDIGLPVFKNEVRSIIARDSQVIIASRNEKIVKTQFSNIPIH